MECIDGRTATWLRFQPAEAASRFGPLTTLRAAGPAIQDHGNWICKGATAPALIAARQSVTKPEGGPSRLGKAGRCGKEALWNDLWPNRSHRSWFQPAGAASRSGPVLCAVQQFLPRRCKRLRRDSLSWPSGDRFERGTEPARAQIAATMINVQSMCPSMHTATWC